jgi:hypothetical protein
MSNIEEKLNALTKRWDEIEEVSRGEKLPWDVCSRLSNGCDRLRHLKAVDDLDQTLLDNESKAFDILFKFLEKHNLVGDPSGRRLTEAEINYCSTQGYETGYDSDDPREVECQLCHIAYPYEQRKGTLCQAPYLWFHGGAIEEGFEEFISCLECLNLLELEMRKV